MEHQLTKRVKELIAGVLETDVSGIADGATQEDVEGWDSMGHLNIIMEIEKSFDNISFSTEEALNIRSIPKIVEAIRGKLGGN